MSAMSPKHRSGLAGLAIAWGMIACTPDDPLTPKPSPPHWPRAPQLAIVDGKNGGADAFRWLPPFSADADYTGTNDHLQVYATAATADGVGILPASPAILPVRPTP